MVRKLIQLLIVLFVVELIILIWVGSKIGVLNTVSLLFLSALIGLIVARSRGLASFRKVQQQLALGVPPGHAMLDGVLLLVGAVLLIFPGFISDILGILLFVPYTRKGFHQLVFNWLRDRVDRKFR